MNLLPKITDEFSSKNYWDSFILKRGDDYFDWYGEYLELCEQLHKYMRKADKILVPACGNSTISGDLYKVGFRNITNVHISEIVITQMKQKYSTICPEMTWIHGNVFNMDFEDDSFTCILDKGTLDALMSDKNSDQANKYFNEINRIMKIGGRFICISLLQEHVLKTLLNWFPSNSWIVRFTRSFDAEKRQSEKGSFPMPVYVVICTKFKKMNSFNPIIEIDVIEGETLHRVENKEKVVNTIQSTQQFALLKHNLQNKKVTGEDIKFELCDSKSGLVRYKIFIIDSPRLSNNLKFAVFIVPQGREHEYIFSSHNGQIGLAESCSTNRLAIIHLIRNQKYKNLEEVQNELSERIIDFAPKDMKQKKVPFLSVGQDLNAREEIYRGKSSFSGEFIIEDVSNNNNDFTYRRLIFMNNLNVIQSEAKLIKNKIGDKNSYIVDPTYLSCSHHSLMVSSLQFVKTSYESLVLIIGLGGGALATFIHDFFPKSSITAIDIDEAILNAAKNWFYFKTSSRLKCHISDGIDFVNESSKNGNKFDLVMIDVDSKEVNKGLSCPPESFLQTEFLDKVLNILSEEGLLIVNLVCRDEFLKQSIILNIKKIFSYIMKISVPEEVNDVLFCKRIQGNFKFKEQTQKLNKYLKKKLKHTKNFIDIEELTELITFY